MKKKINKPLRLFLRGLKYFCLLMVVLIVGAIGTLYYKLEKEPIDLSFLLPQVETYISPSGNLHLSADSIVLNASATRLGLFHVQIDNLEIKDKQNLTIIALPNVKFSYGIWQLLSLNPIPKTVYVEKAYLHLTLTKDGRFILEDQEGTIAYSTPIDLLKDTNQSVLVDHQAIIINDFVKPLNLFYKLRRFTLKDSALVVNDLKENKKIVFPNLNLTVKRRRFFQYDIESTAKILTQNNAPMQLSLNGKLKSVAKTLSFNAAFNHLKLDEVGRAFDLFKGFKVTLKGNVNGEIDFSKKDETLRNVIKKMDFSIETTNNGSVYLPHPLDIVYPIQKITAQGVFRDGLDKLKIQPVEVALTTGLTADVDISISGIGQFFDTNDMNDIQTTINARLKHIPMNEVSNVWPSYLGPTAHAWVKENLIGGEASTALFTLYFTGSEITDLVGDVDFEGVSVHYLRPQPPIEQAGGKVMLYPDRVEIFAHTGMLGNIKLDVGNVYLTELLDDISNAKIELNVTGPINEMLTIIDSKPFDLIKPLGFAPQKTSGLANGQVVLNFPLTDDLKPIDVRADVKASIQNSTIELPFDQLLLKSANLELEVNNDRLKVEGNAQVFETPFKLKWEEFFDVSKPKDKQSVYEVSGLLSDSFLAPYYKDITAFLNGHFYSNMKIEKTYDGTYYFDISSDLTPANVSLYPLTYFKNAGKRATLKNEFSVLPKKGLTDIYFDYKEGENVKIKGKSQFEKDGFSLFLDNVKTSDSSFNGSIEYYQKEFLKVNLKGSSWNLSGLKDFPLIKNSLPNPKAEHKMTPIGGNDLSEIYFDVDFDSLTLKKDMPLKQVSLKAYRNGSLWQNLFLFAMGREAISVNLTPKKGKLDALTNDVGDLLNRLGFSDQFEKGKAKIEAKILPNGGFSGELTLKDINLKKPGFIMQAVTILGIWDALSGNDLSFSNGSIPFALSPNFTLFIQDGVTYGTALGVTFSGRASFSALAISGSVIPAYIINSLPGRIPIIGQLFKDSKGGGLVGVKYDLTGTPGNPRVSFNPLSSIAPGILGRFFK
ncbi:MAG: hypothetical protein IJY92_02820 [Alphaproteobacteria bacterium]|nr:hypothetical protein [Alphaproteobacteria bacterium]